MAINGDKEATEFSVSLSGLRTNSMASSTAVGWSSENWLLKRKCGRNDCIERGWRIILTGHFSYIKLSSEPLQNQNASSV